MCIVCLLFFSTISNNFVLFFFFEGGEKERVEKNPFSTCTCIYYDVHLAHLRVRRLSHTL